MSSKFLNVKGVADELSIGVDTVKKLIEDGRIPAVDVGAGERTYWRVAREDLDAWVAASKTSGAA